MGIRLRLKLSIFIALLMGVAMLSPFSIKASPTEIVPDPTLTFTFNSSDYQKLVILESDINAYAGFSFFTVGNKEDNSITGSSTCSIKLNINAYSDLSQEEKTDQMETTLEIIKDSGLSTTSRNRVYKFIESQDESTASLVRQLSNDVSGDFASAYYIFKPFTGTLGTILGFAAIILFATFTAMILIDIAYLTISPLQGVLAKADTNAKPKFISVEAWRAHKESEDGKHSSNVLSLYARKKVAQIVTLSICLLYLFEGQIYTVIGNIMEMFRGLLD